MNFLTISVMCSLVRIYDTRTLVDDYTIRRDELLKEERLQSLGGKLTLTNEEEEANDILMQWKRKEIEESFHDPQHFNFSKHYFTYKQHIETSKVFQIIRKMPKGAALHIHSSFMLDADSLLDLTYEDHLYACYHNDLKLQFSGSVPTLECPVKWTLLSELRDASDNATLFDENIKRYFTLVADDEDVLDASINKVWTKFERIHKTVKPLIGYRPAREKYFYKTLERFYADNVMYIEMRSGISSLYELDGTKHDKIFMARLYRDITKKFMEEHPDFIGVKVIIACYRAADEKRVRETLELASKVKAEMPDMFAGFDLVGQEDLGRPLKDFVPILRKYNDIDYYFHAGETGWFGSLTDENLVDAVLLDSKRIGHAYALVKHPTLLRMVSDKGTGIEVNVISNAVLSLVRDVRNHPLATYLALDLPVVLSSDDPSAWGAQPLSHDFYVAFVIVASRNYDLRMLKQLALNSIKYSALDREGKKKLFKVFKDRWYTFIKELRDGNTRIISASEKCVDSGTTETSASEVTDIVESSTIVISDKKGPSPILCKLSSFVV